MSTMDDRLEAKMTIVANKKKNMTMNMKKMRMKYISAAASLLRPYISEQNYWVLQHHEVIDIMGSLIFSLEYFSCKLFADFPDPILWESMWC